MTNAYDGFGRLKSSTTNMDGVARTMSSQYDAAGNRIALSGTDGGYYAPFSYDAAGRMTAYTGVTSFVYDAFGRRQGVDLGPGSAWETWHYDAAGRLDVQDHHMGVAPQTLTFGYNAASQIVSRTSANAGYDWTPPYDVSRSYQVNGLNQYTDATGTGAASYLYDANGNLRSDGSSSFVYDAENRLVSATGAKNATLSYDPLGRLWQISSAAGGTTRFEYDGDRLVMELDGSGNVTRAYVHGPGADEPMVAYGPEGRRYLHADHQGSIIAANDDAGNATQVNKYDPWGVPGSNNQGRFQYTGQAWIPELGMYYYKARIYWPTIGRFMQTDPIGYEGGINIYAYVGNDPMNLRDPAGTESCPAARTCPDIPKAPATVEAAMVAALQKAPVTEGQKETGVQVMVEKNDGTAVAETRTGTAAGHQDRENPMMFSFKRIGSADGYKLGADGHTHPRQGDRGTIDLNQRRLQQLVNNRNLFPSRNDYHHMNATNAPMFNRNPAGAITETYRIGNIDHTVVIVPGKEPLGLVPKDLSGVVVDQ